MEDRYEDLIQRGVDAMAEEKFDVALDQFQKALPLDPRNMQGYLHIGNAYMNLQETDKAIETFRRALLLDENNVQALYSIACAYFINDDPANAIRYFNKVEERGGATVDMYLIESALFIDAEDYNMSVRCINRALQLQPLSADLMINKAEIYVAMGRTDDAVSTLHDLQELLPDEVEGYAVEAQILLDADRSEDALSALDRVQQRFPADLALRVLRAKAFNNLGRYDEALKNVEQALVAGSLEHEVKSDAQLQQSIALAGLGRLDEATDVLEGSAMEGNASESYYMLMNEALIIKQYDKALDAAEKLLSLDEEVPDRIKAAAHFNKAFAIEKSAGIDAAREAYADAAVYLRRITIAQPGLYEVYAYRMLAHKALREFDQALEIADYLISLDPTAPASYALKSDILRAKGDYDEADKLKARVLQLDPEFRFGE